jgi:hypothetical protein
LNRDSVAGASAGFFPKSALVGVDARLAVCVHPREEEYQRTRRVSHRVASRLASRRSIEASRASTGGFIHSFIRSFVRSTFARVVVVGGRARARAIVRTLLASGLTGSVTPLAALVAANMSTRRRVTRTTAGHTCVCH